MLCLVTCLLRHIGLSTRGWGCSQSDLCAISVNLSMRGNLSVGPRRGYFLSNAVKPGGMLMLRVGFCIYPLSWKSYIMGRSSQISVVILFCSSPACPNLSFSQPRPQALMRYQVTEGGLEPNAIARGVLGEFSRRARWVTSQLIFRRGRLGTRLSFNSNKICNFRLQKRRCHRKDTLCASKVSL